MLVTAAKAALRGGLDAAKRAVPNLLAHKLITVHPRLTEGVRIIESSDNRKLR